MKKFLAVLILILNLSYVFGQDQNRPCLNCQGEGGGGGGSNPPPCQSTKSILYVDASVSSIGNGYSWKFALKDLQSALAIANNCPNIKHIRVAKGTYVPSTIVNANARDYTFFIGESYDLKGGYPGGAGTDSSIRDFVNNPTILKGVIQEFYEAYHVLLVYGVSGVVSIDGFQIKDGFADGSGSMEIESNVFAPRNVGAAAYLRDALDISFENCVFYNNVAADASGAIYNRNSNLKLVNCIFVNNTCGTDGGAIQNVSGSDITITNCTFYNNFSLGGGEAIYTNTGSTVTINNSIIWGNTKAFAGGGTRAISHCLLPNSGGANFNITDDPKFMNVSNLNGPDNKWFTQDDGLNLEVCSPALNRGDNDVATVINKDITNFGRIYNVQVDMGAYEKQDIPYMSNASYRSLNNDSSDNYVYNGLTSLNVKNECRFIAVMEPVPNNALNGRIKAKTIIESTDLSYEGIPFVRRHYNINDELANQNNNSYVRLFYSNSDFTNYNLRSDVLAKLPVNSSDPNKVNLRIIKYGAVSQTGSPDSYNTSPEALTKYQVAVTWIASSSTWEVAFLNTDGLGGYFITAAKDYVFTGNGNWNVAANWQNNEMPPKTLPAYYKIIVANGSNAILNTPQNLAKYAIMRVENGATLTIATALNVNGSVFIDVNDPLRNTVIVGK